MSTAQVAKTSFCLANHLSRTLVLAPQDLETYGPACLISSYDIYLSWVSTAFPFKSLKSFDTITLLIS